MSYSIIALHFSFMFFFFFNDTATTEIYTLSLHDALPIFNYELGGIRSVVLKSARELSKVEAGPWKDLLIKTNKVWGQRDRKSTRLNSSHANISYAVFCLKKKKKTIPYTYNTQETIMSYIA